MSYTYETQKRKICSHGYKFVCKYNDKLKKKSQDLQRRKCFFQIGRGNS